MFLDFCSVECLVTFIVQVHHVNESLTPFLFSLIDLIQRFFFKLVEESIVEKQSTLFSSIA